MVQDHPQRATLVAELHARPYPTPPVPGYVALVAFKEPHEAARRDRARDYGHLGDLLARHGRPAPPEGVTHWDDTLGRYQLKWESHTEFVTYAAASSGLSSRAFEAPEMAIFPQDWQARAPGLRLCAVLLRLEPMPESEDQMIARAGEWFVAESLASAEVLDGAAVVFGDFRLDENGIMRFAVFVRAGTGPRRVGRIVQHLTEIETYRAMSMLGLGRARPLGGDLDRIEARLGETAMRMADQAQPAQEVLDELLGISAELERLAARFSYRAGATAAYEAIVNDRLDLLEERRFHGRQTLGDFMRRRYDPAMRTVKSAEKRLQELLERATRASGLLRSRVEVEQSRQTQLLLRSMDQRSDLQLRLQTTVEGLSVVAISYYAVNLMAYLLAPFAEGAGLGKAGLTALLVLPVMAAVWGMIRRIRRKFH